MTATAIPLLTVLWILCLTVAAIFFCRQRQLIASLRLSRDRLQTEEHRAFDFLHRLGRALEESDSAASLHRHIVEGLVRAMDVDGGALYLADSDRGELAPEFVSPLCPALVELPDGMSGPEGPDPAELTNFQRLRSLPQNHAIYGEVFQRRRRLALSNLAQYPAFQTLAFPVHEGVRVLAEPLIYAGRPLGFLVVANRGDKEDWKDNQIEVFHSLAEQSAFALGSAMLHREARDKRLLENELRTAREVQRILMPAKAPRLASFDIAGVNFPAKVVSGDYYDFLEVDEDHLGIAIADVSGKGVPASLIMASCRSALRARARGEISPSEVLKSVNRQIFPDIREDMFITMIYLILEGGSDRVRLARAGHHSPLLFRGATGEVERIAAVGTAVGIDSGGVFDRVIKDQEFDFREGDMLLLTTDGVSEALNLAEEEFGDDRIRQALQNYREHAAAGILERIYEELHEFAGKAEQSDDITLIAVKKGSKVEAPSSES